MSDCKNNLAEDRASEQLTDTRVMEKVDDGPLGFATNAPPDDPYRRWRENLARLARLADADEQQKLKVQGETE